MENTDSMIIEPKVRGFICTTAHPEGCAQNIARQIAYAKKMPATQGAGKVLVIGASTGYGLASRIACAYSCGADTIGVIFDKPSKNQKRTATPGWYNTAAFERCATQDGLYAKSINGDAFSQEIKDQTIEMIRRDWGKADMVIYSLAAPRRTTPDGQTYQSVLKTTGDSYTNQTINLRTGEIAPVTIEPATGEEIDATVKVMGGEDWKLWIDALTQADVLEKDAVTVAYSYIGPEVTYPIYKEGSIGQAKKDLYRSATEICDSHPGIRAVVSVNKAVVTQSSAAIPIVPLYLSILFKVMKEEGLHENCMEQMYRMIHDRIFTPEGIITDEQGLIRMDDWEMKPEVQDRVKEIWNRVEAGEITTDNLKEYTDIEGYWQEFYEMFGFSLDGVDYGQDVDIDQEIPSLQQD